MVVHCLLEVLEGRKTQHGLRKVFPQTGEAKNKRVFMCSQPGFWKVIQERVTGSKNTCIWE